MLIPALRQPARRRAHVNAAIAAAFVSGAADGGRTITVAAARDLCTIKCALSATAAKLSVRQFARQHVGVDQARSWGYDWAAAQTP